MINKTLVGLSIAELRQRTQSNAPEAGRDPIIGHSIRFFSIYFTRVLLKFGVTPFWVTALSVFLFLIGIATFGWNILWLNLVGIVVIYISIVLDGCNGEVARLYKYRPDIGSIYIEPISHDIQYGLMFIPLTIGAYMIHGSKWIILAGFIATIAKLLQRFFISRFDHIILGEMKQTDTEGEVLIPYDPNVSFPHKVYRFLNRNFFSSVGFIIPLLVFLLLGHVEWFIYLFAAFNFVIMCLHFLKQVRYVIRIDKPGIPLE